jgi:TatD DNase family protein
MTPKYIDIHTHVNFKTFKEDGDEVIKRALEAGVWLINVGSQFSTSKRAVEIAHRYPEGVYAIVGLHPIHLEESFHDEDETIDEGFMTRAEVFDKEAYRKLLEDPKVVALGECGLDYFHLKEESIEKQKQALIAQIELANEVGKPLMLHVRNDPKNKNVDAYKDALEILKKYAKVKGDMHFFAGSKEVAKELIDFGFMISFTGVITFTHDYDEVVREVPLDMIMSETDAPYVAPVPYRGKRNEPSYVKEVVKKIAEIKGLPEAEVAKAVMANARRLFGI